MNWSVLIRTQKEPSFTSGRLSELPGSLSKLPANKNEPPDRLCVVLHTSGRMRGDTWASTCPVACLLYMPEDTTTSTWLSACLGFMRHDTHASACRFACADHMYYDTLFFCFSSCMEMLHARLHLLFLLTLSRLNG
ncbi:hypothetical protein IGI04_030196 [Brassica rapa subsp. trilocularis]|uniref:Uncharacterized protein n=1 Tax=Brassica rapa subsp. trilocularis TaxID=1813537 RepID=A0ABQ7LRJ7_BRACM|nr:hypothetical protein IGI04_030196 [Brassica rapa subsp. trilocularis]